MNKRLVLLLFSVVGMNFLGCGELFGMKKRKKSSAPLIHKLPNEMFAEIFVYLIFKDYKSIYVVNKSFNEGWEYFLKTYNGYAIDYRYSPLYRRASQADYNTFFESFNDKNISERIKNEREIILKRERKIKKRREIILKNVDLLSKSLGDQRKLSMKYYSCGLYINDKLFTKIVDKLDKRLKCLILDGCYSITENGFNPLSRLTNLTELGLYGCHYNITGEFLKYLKDLINLRELDLSGCENITDESFKYLKNLTNITKLDIHRCNKITDVTLKFIADNLKKIESLNILNCSKITYDGCSYAVVVLKNLCDLIVDTKKTIISSSSYSSFNNVKCSYFNELKSFIVKSGKNIKLELE